MGFTTPWMVRVPTKRETSAPKLTSSFSNEVYTHRSQMLSGEKVFGQTRQRLSYLVTMSSCILGGVKVILYLRIL